MSGNAPHALIATGLVRHTRLRPRRHAFSYATYFLMLPMRSLRATAATALVRNRFGLIAFCDADHGDGRTDSLAWAEELLAREGVTDADGEIWLHCLPRVLGYAFKPVSFWFCQRRDGTLAAVIVEVNNTFGERHCYLLGGAHVGYGRELQARKEFHVSPFCEVAGEYRFRFLCAGLHPAPDAGRTSDQAARSIARIEHRDGVGTLIVTSVCGTLEALTPATARAAFFGTPLMTLGVIARIHWQALRLWRKRVPFFRKPEPPRAFVTRGTAPSSPDALHP